MTLVAVVVLVVMIPLSVWAWSKEPGRKAAEQFKHIMTYAWGKQLIVDFFGLEVVLALWMISDAAVRGTWLSAMLCIITMPLFGSMAAAVYWLSRAF